MLKRTPEQETLHGLFHKAWGQATSSPEYDKEVWRRLSVIIDNLTRARPSETPPPASRPSLASNPGPEWNGFPVGHLLAIVGADMAGLALPSASLAAIEAWFKERASTETEAAP